MSPNELFQLGKISKGHYKTYLIFEENDEGKDWLKNMLESTVLERVPPIGDHAYAWQDGRLSLLRDISLMIMEVKNLMEQKHD